MESFKQQVHQDSVNHFFILESNIQDTSTILKYYPIHLLTRPIAHVEFMSSPCVSFICDVCQKMSKFFHLFQLCHTHRMMHPMTFKKKKKKPCCSYSPQYNKMHKHFTKERYDKQQDETQGYKHDELIHSKEAQTVSELIPEHLNNTFKTLFISFLSQHHLIQTGKTHEDDGLYNSPICYPKMNSFEKKTETHTRQNHYVTSSSSSSLLDSSRNLCDCQCRHWNLCHHLSTPLTNHHFLITCCCPILNPFYTHPLHFCLCHYGNDIQEHDEHSSQLLSDNVIKQVQNNRKGLTRKPCRIHRSSITSSKPTHMSVPLTQSLTYHNDTSTFCNKETNICTSEDYQVDTSYPNQRMSDGYYIQDTMDPLIKIGPLFTKSTDATLSRQQRNFLNSKKLLFSTEDPVSYTQTSHHSTIHKKNYLLQSFIHADQQNKKFSRNQVYIYPIKRGSKSSNIRNKSYRFTYPSSLMKTQSFNHFIFPKKKCQYFPSDTHSHQPYENQKKYALLPYLRNGQKLERLPGGGHHISFEYETNSLQASYIDIFSKGAISTHKTTSTIQSLHHYSRRDSKSFQMERSADYQFKRKYLFKQIRCKTTLAIFQKTLLSTLVIPSYQTKRYLRKMLLISMLTHTKKKIYKDQDILPLTDLGLNGSDWTELNGFDSLSNYSSLSPMNDINSENTGGSSHSYHRHHQCCCLFKRHMNRLALSSNKIKANHIQIYGVINNKLKCKIGHTLHQSYYFHQVIKKMKPIGYTMYHSNVDQNLSLCPPYNLTYPQKTIWCKNHIEQSMSSHSNKQELQLNNTTTVCHRYPYADKHYPMLFPEYKVQDVNTYETFSMEQTHHSLPSSCEISNTIDSPSNIYSTITSSFQTTDNPVKQEYKKYSNTTPYRQINNLINYSKSFSPSIKQVSCQSSSSSSTNHTLSKDISQIKHYERQSIVSEQPQQHTFYSEKHNTLSIGVIGLSYTDTIWLDDIYDPSQRFRMYTNLKFNKKNIIHVASALIGEHSIKRFLNGIRLQGFIARNPSSWTQRFHCKMIFSHVGQLLLKQENQIKELPLTGIYEINCDPSLLRQLVQHPVLESYRSSTSVHSSYSSTSSSSSDHNGFLSHKSSPNFLQPPSVRTSSVYRSYQSELNNVIIKKPFKTSLIFRRQRLSCIRSFQNVQDTIRPPNKEILLLQHIRKQMQHFVLIQVYYEQCPLVLIFDSYNDLQKFIDLLLFLQRYHGITVATVIDPAYNTYHHLHSVSRYSSNRQLIRRSLLTEQQSTCTNRHHLKFQLTFQKCRRLFQKLIRRKCLRKNKK